MGTALLAAVALLIPGLPAAAAAPPVLSLSLSPASVAEGTGSVNTCATVLVTLDQPAPFDIEVAFGPVDGTATAEVDYTPFTRADLLHAGETGISYERCFVTQDGIDESDETIVFRLTAGPGVTIDPAEATLTVVDDDAPVVVGISLDPHSVEEGTGSASSCTTVQATVSRPAPLDIEVFYGTATGGTATEGTDYAPFVRTDVIREGNNGSTFTVCFIVQDAVDEPNESIFFQLTASTPGVTVNPGNATLTVIDDDRNASTTVLGSSANPSIAGQPVTFTAAVVGAAGTSTPTGSVEFTIDGITVGQPALVDGTATVTTATLRPGVHIVRAEYGGDGSHEPSSAELSHLVIDAVATALTLTPETASVPTDAQHCTTATVTDQLGRPLADVTVRFAATGATTAGDTLTTDGSGRAGFCFASPMPGTVSVTAYADANGNGARDGGEPGDTAAVTITRPASTAGCTIQGSGAMIADNGDRVLFNGSAVMRTTGVTGAEQYVDNGPAARLTINTTTLQSGTCSADRKRGTIFGTATVSGRTVTLRIDLGDNSRTGSTDTYRIRLSTGYDSGQHTLTAGDVAIR